MQAHRGVAGPPIGTTFLKIGRVVYEKKDIFLKLLEKIKAIPYISIIPDFD